MDLKLSRRLPEKTSLQLKHNLLLEATSKVHFMLKTAHNKLHDRTWTKQNSIEFITVHIHFSAYLNITGAWFQNIARFKEEF